MKECKMAQTSCMVCLDTKPVVHFYKIQCGAKVPHVICHDCESDMRMKERPIINARDKIFGRFLKCPMCRVTESTMGERSQESWQRETVALYKTTSRSLTNKKIQELEETIRLAETTLRFLQEENSALLDENVHLRNLCGLVAPVAPEPEVAPVAAPVVAPIESLKSWCASGRRETRECTTRGKTSRQCSFPTCEKRVCRSCRMCTTH
jgi:hypothetical protein